MAEFAHGEHAEDEEHLHRSASVATAERGGPESAGNTGIPFAVGGLVVGSADDPLEAAADRAADAALSRIRRMAAPSADLHQHAAGCGHQGIRRSATHAGDGATIGYEGGNLDTMTNSKINSMRGSGKPLDTDLRTTMESAFGSPLGGVRVHTGSDAAQISRQISAKAFTTGNDIFFGEGQFRPDSPDGAHTLAHEIAHTLQPSGGIGRLIQRVVGGDVLPTQSKSARKRAAKKARKVPPGITPKPSDGPIEGEEPAPDLVIGPKAPAEIPPGRQRPRLPNPRHPLPSPKSSRKWWRRKSGSPTTTTTSSTTRWPATHHSAGTGRHAVLQRPPATPPLGRRRTHLLHGVGRLPEASWGRPRSRTYRHR